MNRPRLRTLAALGALAATCVAVSAAYATDAPTWHAAQVAAKFKLMEPTTTGMGGLTLAPPISISRCEVSGELSKRQVFGAYGAEHNGPAFDLYETNAPFPCGDGEQSKVLGHPTVHAHRATLNGFCSNGGLPPCKAPSRAVYVLDWHERGLTLMVTGIKRSSAQVLTFARSLHTFG